MPTLYEGENAFLSGAQTSTFASGYTGTAYARYFGVGHYVEWTINTVTTDTSDLTFRYNLNSCSHNMAIEVNGTTVAAALAFPSTGVFGNWPEITLSDVALNAGVNTVRATTDNSTNFAMDNLLAPGGGNGGNGVCTLVIGYSQVNQWYSAGFEDFA